MAESGKIRRIDPQVLTLDEGILWEVREGGNLFDPEYGSPIPYLSKNEVRALESEGPEPDD